MIMHHAAKIKSSLTGFLYMALCSVKASEAHLGCGGKGDLNHECAAAKYAATAYHHHVNMDQDL